MDLLDTRVLNVQITQMIDPSTFKVKEIIGPNASHLTQEFAKLIDDMRDYYDDMKTLRPPDLREGKEYVGRFDEEWRRVKYHGTMTTTTGPKARCYLLDYGRDNVLIPLCMMREAKKEFLCLPHQIREIVLEGVTPLSLFPDAELRMHLRPGKKWDVSAERFVKNCMKEIQEWQVHIVSGSENSKKLSVRLFGFRGDQRICLNDELVQGCFGGNEENSAQSTTSRESPTSSVSEFHTTSAQSPPSYLQTPCSAASGSMPFCPMSPEVLLGPNLQSLITASDTCRAPKSVSQVSRKDRTPLEKPEPYVTDGGAGRSRGLRMSHFTPPYTLSSRQSPQERAAVSYSPASPEPAQLSSASYESDTSIRSSLPVKATAHSSRSSLSPQSDRNQQSSVRLPHCANVNKSASSMSGKLSPCSVAIPQTNSDSGDRNELVSACQVAGFGDGDDSGLKPKTGGLGLGFGDGDGSGLKPKTGGLGPGFGDGDGVGLKQKTGGLGRGKKLQELLNRPFTPASRPGGTPFGNGTSQSSSRVASPLVRSDDELPSSGTLNSVEHAPELDNKLLTSVTPPPQAGNVAAGAVQQITPKLTSPQAGNVAAGVVQQITPKQPAILCDNNLTYEKNLSTNESFTTADSSTKLTDDGSRPVQKLTARLPKVALMSQGAVPQPEKLPKTSSSPCGAQSKADDCSRSSPAVSSVDRSIQPARVSHQTSGVSSYGCSRSSNRSDSMVLNNAKETAVSASSRNSEAKKTYLLYNRHEPSDSESDQSSTGGRDSADQRFMMHCTERFNNDDDELEVFIDGPVKVTCEKDIVSLSFYDLIMSTPGLHMDHPTRFQSFGWPATFTLLDVIGVAPSYDSDHAFGGKSLSYLPPLICLLENKQLYRELPSHDLSAYMIILCATWSKARKVYDLCHQLVFRRGLVKEPLIVFGGSGNSATEEVSLVNGSDILITTPDCLLRLMAKRVTNLNRLCHMVLEEADVLAEHFMPQLYEILNQYKLVLLERDRKTTPRQLLMFATHWTENMRKLSADYQVEPFVIIASKINAAYYGRINQVAVVCSSTDRIRHVQGRLVSAKKKCVIFTSNDVDAEKLHNTLKCASIYTLLAHGGMRASELKDVESDWKQPRSKSCLTVLVISDTAHRLIERIDGATTVIHYDIPSGLKTFGDRLWTMRHCFQRYNSEQLPADEGVSVLLVPDDSGAREKVPTVARKVMTILKRSNSLVPAKMREMYDRQTRHSELKLREPLCHSLMSYGTCRSRHCCSRRHHVFTSIDSPGSDPHHIELPSEGVVKVHVTSVRDATCYYVRLLEHTWDTKTTDYNMTAKSLLLDIQMYFCDTSNIRVCDDVDIGSLYAWQDNQHIFHRVLVVQADRPSQGVRPESVYVRFIDRGGEQQVALNQLYKLPERFINVPYQAVEVFICRLRPLDNDVEWTDAANSFVATKISGKVLEGKIVLSIGNTLWLDPLVEKEWLPHLKEWIVKFSLRELLIHAEFAVENPEHMDLLYAACEGSELKLPNVRSADNICPNQAYTCGGQIVATKTVAFPVDCTEIMVKVTYAETPGLIYVQLVDNQKIVDQIEEDVRKHVMFAKRATFKVREGLLVLALFSDTWYRGKIVSTWEDNRQARVFFVDYGDWEDIEYENLLPMPVVLRHIPFQAIECCCLDVSSLNPLGDWEEESCDAFSDITLNQDLKAKICCHSSAQITGSNRYGIRLFNESQEYTFNIASYFVRINYSLLPSTKLKELVCAQNKLVETPELKRLANICCSVLQCQEVDVFEIERLVQQISRSSFNNEGLVKMICETLEYCWKGDVASALLDALRVFVVDNPQHCDEMCVDGDNVCFWDNVCHMLDKIQSQELLNAILAFLEVAVTCDRCAITFAERGGLRLLIGLCDQTQMQESILSDCLHVIGEVIARFAHVPDVDFTDLSIGIAKGCHHCLCGVKELMSSSSPEVISRCLRIACLLVPYNSRLYDIFVSKYNGLNDLCREMKSWTSRPLLLLGATLLEVIICHEDITKDLIMSSGVYATLKGLLTGDDIADELHKTCQEVYSRISSLLPPKLLQKLKGVDICESSVRPVVSTQQPALNQPLIADEMMVIRERRHPLVYWAQSKCSLLLTVDVKDVIQTEGMFRSTGSSIHFRTLSMSVEYYFNLNLYAEVTFCEVKVSSSCVYIGIHKETPALWPQLVKAKHRQPVYIKADIDHSALSSSDEDDSDDDEPLALITRSVRNNVQCPWSSGMPQSAANGPLPAEEVSDVMDYESSDSDSEADDIHFDPDLREDKMLGFHVVS